MEPERQLAPPPEDPRARELWLQHAAGHIFWKDVRGYALDQLDPGLDDVARAAAEKAINDALYGMMMVADGVTGCLRGPDHRVDVRIHVRLLMGEGAVFEDLDLFDGDGVCKGYHGWLEGDFGEDPVFVE